MRSMGGGTDRQHLCLCKAGPLRAKAPRQASTWHVLLPVRAQLCQQVGLLWDLDLEDEMDSEDSVKCSASNNIFSLLCALHVYVHIGAGAGVCR